MQKKFERIPFPATGNIVYTIGLIREAAYIPFYVGQTTRNVGRFGDYISAKFSASTDFKVGEAVKYLRNLGYDVAIEYKEIEGVNRRAEESRIINEYRRNYELLNDLPGYDYSRAIEKDERLKIHEFVMRILKRPATTDNININKVPSRTDTVLTLEQIKKELILQ